MGWAKDKTGQSYYVESIEDCCVIKIERWEHGYYVAVFDEYSEVAVPLKYFYTFQDARSFFTSLVRLMKQENNDDNTSCYL